MESARFGSMLDHLRDEAIESGKAECSWAALRNAYFRAGDGWEDFMAWAAQQNLCWGIEQQAQASGEHWPVVVLHPAAARKATPGARIY